MSGHSRSAITHVLDRDAEPSLGSGVAAKVRAVDIAFIRGVGYGVTLGGCLWVLRYT